MYVADSYSTYWVLFICNYNFVTLQRIKDFHKRVLKVLKKKKTFENHVIGCVNAWLATNLVAIRIQICSPVGYVVLVNSIPTAVFDCRSIRIQSSRHVFDLFAK